MPVGEGVDLDIVVVAMAVARVRAQVGRQLPRGVAVVQVCLRRPPVHHRVQACAGTATGFVCLRVSSCVRVQHRHVPQRRGRVWASEAVSPLGD